MDSIELNEQTQTTETNLPFGAVRRYIANLNEDAKNQALMQILCHTDEVLPFFYHEIEAHEKAFTFVR